MKRLTLIATFFLSLTYASLAAAGEVTDKEFNVLDQLVVTYYSGGSGEIQCTAFNAIGSAIGGGASYAEGGVARVAISVPKKYVGKDLRVKCK